MITLTVKLYAQFRVGRFKIEQQTYRESISAHQVIANLGIAEEELGVLMVNGRRADLGQLLADGDVLGIFPLVGGG